MTDWLLNDRQYALLAVPFLAFAEACIGIGLFVSGLILFSVTTLLYNAGVLSLTDIAVLAFPGAVLGDQAGFHAGRFLGPGIHHTKFGRRYAAQIQKAEQMIKRYAGGAVFIGRFIPAIRSLIPATLGISGFETRRYLVLDIAACALWSVALAWLSWLAAQTFQA